MAWLGIVAAVVLIAVMLIDAFESMLLPRRVRHGYRLARLFYRTGWCVWRRLACQLSAGRWRHALLSIFGPLSLLGLFAVWAVGLITGFALLHWSLGTALSWPRDSEPGLVAYCYFSGTTFFTLGYGDVVPTAVLGRLLAVAEAGLGFGFLAIIITYLPVLYQAFSRREIVISLLDARAGSPPSAGEFLRRLANARTWHSVDPLLSEWERWSAELLESHLSFPVLSFYRSQHDNQSWVATLVTILDTSAVLIAGVDGTDGHQARLTFAMARHAAVDLGLVFGMPPLPVEENRLPSTDLDRMRAAGVKLHEGPGVATALTELRALYEPFVNALANHFQYPLPPFLPNKPPVDNWQTSPWMARSPGLSRLPAGDTTDEHAD
jgi:hypothetical protein